MIIFEFMKHICLQVFTCENLHCFRVGLLTAVDLHGDALPQQRLNFCMERLRKLIHQCLRRGDVFARYSPSQYIIMLPCANYANSCKVMERVIKRFQRENPNSPAILHYSVQPLEPEE